MEQLIKQLIELANDNPNGFTVYLPSLQPVTSGYIVALAETQNSFGFEGCRKAVEVALRMTAAIGGWKYGGDYYWDAVLIFEDQTEAITAGKENGQIAIYNMNENREIRL